MGAFAIASIYRAPGLQQVADQLVEELLVHPDEGGMFKVGVQLAAGYPMIKVGDVLAMITSGASSGKYRRYTKGIAAAAQLTGDSSFIMTDRTGNTAIAPPFKAGDIVTVGAAATKTVQSVDPTTGRVYLTTTLGAAVAVGDAVALTTDDGSGTAACVAARPVYPTAYNYSNPTSAVLDMDYVIDGIWQGIVRLSVVRGLDTNAITTLGARLLTPWMDAVQIR